MTRRHWGWLGWVTYEAGLDGGAAHVVEDDVVLLGGVVPEREKKARE